MEIENPEFSLFSGGLLNRLCVTLRLEKLNAPRFGRRILFLGGIAMVPLVVLCLFQGTAWGNTVHIPLFYDPGVLAQFCFSLPLLILAEKGISREISNAAGYFKSSGIIQQSDVRLYDRGVARANQWSNSSVAESAILFLVLVSFYFRPDVDVGFVGGLTQWQWNPDTEQWGAAGLWSRGVSFTIYRFILLRCVWRFFVWTWFLWTVSRLNLHLRPTHPDRKGGLGILSDTHAPFGMIGLAASAQIAGVLGRSMLYAGTSLASHAVLIGSSIAVLVFVFVLPLCVFNGHLFACRRKALRTYGTLAGHYSGLFDQKWLVNEGTVTRDILGSSDIQSLADLGTGYDTVRGMGLFPLDVRLVSLMTVAAAVPFVPLAFFSYGATEVIVRVVKLIF
jgi:hypothetical protein